MPSKNMSAEAADVTGIKVKGNKMFVKLGDTEQEVVTCTPHEGLFSFLTFLKNQNKPCLLLAHNSFRFDAPRLIQLSITLGLFKHLKVLVKGFTDSLYIFKSLLTERKKKKLSFSETALANDYLKPEDLLVAHNAVNDVLMLQKLMKKLCPNPANIFSEAKTVDFIVNKKKRNEMVKKIKMSLSRFVNVSNHIKNKIATAGITLPILEKTCTTGGKAGLSILLGESINKKPRVTNNKKIIQAIYSNLVKK